MPGKFEGNAASEEVCQMLHAMSLDGWANESSGNVEAPSGFFAKIDIAQAELAEILAAFSDVSKEIDFPGELVGHWLLMEDDRGFVSLAKFPTVVSRDVVYAGLAQDFEAWDSQDGGE